MKCTKCGHQMKTSGPLTMTAEVRGENFAVQVVAPQCVDCGRIVLDAKARRSYHRAASDAFRSAHNLLTTNELDQLRRALNMTWKQFADYVSVGTATLKRWMGGEIQSESLDLLVRLRADLTFVQRSTDELVIRLAVTNTECTTTVPAPTMVRRTRMRVEEVTVVANSQLALCA